MPKIGTSLKMEQTVAKTTGQTQFNTPGNYPIPYGKTKFTVSGRGVPGNANTYSGAYSYNTYVGGNYDTVPGNYVAGEPSHYTETAGSSYRCPDGSNPWYNNGGGYNPPSTTNFAAVSSYGAGSGSGSFNSSYYPPSSYTSGGFYESNSGGYVTYYSGYSSTSNPTYYVNNSYSYSTYVPASGSPGNAGSPTNYLGVTFPGGAADSVAAVIGETIVSIPYSGSGQSVTVPSGGYITIKNL